jgi:hypothetical protein
MDVQEVIQSQYDASLKMMKQVIAQCPQSLWENTHHKNQYWHIAYHALFYTLLYLHPSEEEFVPWPKQRKNYEFMGDAPLPWPPHEVPQIGEPYTQAELLELTEYIQGRVKEIVGQLDFSGESGFSWLPMNKLELQFYTIRHLQLHVGELCERLWQEAKIEVNWIGMGK